MQVRTVTLIGISKTAMFPRPSTLAGSGSTTQVGMLAVDGGSRGQCSSA